jgi:predicted DsbA family dithiol-disulfide isomerase
VHFPLHPETPAEGMTLDALFGARGGDPAERHKEQAQRQERMKALMNAEGLPYGERTHTYNSRLAQELGAWADSLRTDSQQADGSEGLGALHDALFKAYFVQGRNIGDIDTLVEIAESVGLDGKQARKVLNDRLFKKQVDADWAKSRAYGVTGVPTFVAGGMGVVGAQPYEVLQSLMKEAKAETRG